MPAVERTQRILTFPGDSQPSLARDEHTEPAAPFEQPRHVAGAVEHLLEVVEQ